MRFFFNRNKGSNNKKSKNEKISSDIEKTKKYFKEKYSESADIVMRSFIKNKDRLPCFLVYIDGIVERETIQRFIITPVMTEEKRDAKEILSKIITASEVSEESNIKKAIENMHAGDTLLFIDGQSQAIIISTRSWNTRSLTPSTNESSVRGPKESFVETIRSNTALIRKKIQSDRLVLKHITVGSLSQTRVVISYIAGKVNPEMVKEITDKISNSKIEVLSDSGQLERLLEHSTLSIFPQMQNTERPDKVAFELPRGKVAIMVDGSPFTLIIPSRFENFLQIPEDYYDRFTISTFLRSLRLISCLIAVFAPAIYIAMTCFNTRSLPTPLALTIAANRANVPFTAIVEALLMEITIELVREAGIRLPAPVGQSIGIVGGIVLGDATIRSGLTSPSMVVVVAVTSMASFAIPSYSMSSALRLLRFSVMIASSIFGIYGIILSFIIINVHMARLRSGDRYLSLQSETTDSTDNIVYIPRKILTIPPKYEKKFDNCLLGEE